MPETDYHNFLFVTQDNGIMPGVEGMVLQEGNRFHITEVKLHKMCVWFSLGTLR